MSFDPRELGFIRALRGLSSDQILSFLDLCQPIELPVDEVIMVEGEEDDAMVFILEGVLEVFTGTAPEITVLQQLRRGESVGELGIYGLTERRTASVRTIEPSAVLVLERKALDKLQADGHPVAARIEDQVLHSLADRIREADRRIGLLSEGTELEPDEEPEGLWARLAASLSGGGPSGRAPKPLAVLQKSPHFGDLDADLLDRLASNLDAVAFSQGERIIEEGSMKGDAWLVATGKVGVYRATRSKLHEEVGQLGPGALFGHLALIDDHMRTATCVAEVGSWLYRLPRDLAKAVVTVDQPEARALRHCFIHALARQLQQANDQLGEITRLKTAAMRAKHLSDREIEDLNRARMALISA